MAKASKKKTKVEDPNFIGTITVDTDKVIDEGDPNTFSPFVATPEDSLQKDIELGKQIADSDSVIVTKTLTLKEFKEQFGDLYPNVNGIDAEHDQEIQDWMNAPMGKYIGGIDPINGDESDKVIVTDRFGTDINRGQDITFDSTVTAISYNGPATSGYSQPVGPEIDPLKMSDILFTEMVMFKKSKGYLATNVVDLKFVCDESVRKYLVECLNE